MKGMLKLWQQVILIQHTEDRSKLLILIVEDQQDKLIQHTDARSKLLIQIEENWQESNCYFMTWQLSLILQVSHTYIIRLVGYGMKNAIMGVGTFICRVHQVPQKEMLCKSAMSSVSCNFDEGLMMRFDLDEMPLFMRMFCQDCTKYHNLLAMAATKKCNYCDAHAFTNQSPGIHCLTLSRQIIISLQGYPVLTCKDVDYHILFLTVQCHVHVCPNPEMLTKNY
jgi:hypothetical protein